MFPLLFSQLAISLECFLPNSSFNSSKPFTHPIPKIHTFVCRICSCQPFLAVGVTFYNTESVITKIFNTHTHIHMPTEKAEAVCKQKQANKLNCQLSFYYCFLFSAFSCNVPPSVHLQCCSMTGGEPNSPPLKSEQAHLEMPPASISSSPGTHLTSSHNSPGVAACGASVAHFRNLLSVVCSFLLLL